MLRSLTIFTGQHSASPKLGESYQKHARLRGWGNDRNTVGDHVNATFVQELPAETRPAVMTNDARSI
ncbi:MAG: hypothetical protein ABI442_19990 [Gemmatimonadaceae bacterium]